MYMVTHTEIFLEKFARGCKIELSGGGKENELLQVVL